MQPSAWMLTLFLAMPNGVEVPVKAGFADSYEDCRAYGAHEVQIMQLSPLFGAKPKFSCKPVYEAK